MKTKDMPSVRARDFSREAFRNYLGDFPKDIGLLAQSLILKAYIAGYRHGRKTKEAANGK